MLLLQQRSLGLASNYDDAVPAAFIETVNNKGEEEELKAMSNKRWR